MLKTIIQLKNEVNEQHYHDKGKPVYIYCNGERYPIASVDEYDDEVLISTMPIENGGDVEIMEEFTQDGMTEPE